jgi:quinolinate synthase
MTDPTRNEFYIEGILKLKAEKDAVILAHFYQIPEIQELADYIGDSLGLAQQAAETNAKIILFAGVHFMAETAKILNPGKKVLIPDLEAGCSLADSCPAADFKKFKENNPDHIVISYINCSAEVKALSDMICTSGNAVAIVESFPKDQKIIFAPDKNLGSYINNLTGREMLLWDGTCQVHDMLNQEAVVNMKIQHPDAELIAHPECKQAILELASFVGSTTALLAYTKNSAAKKFIVATETGILHQMKKQCPDKEFIIVPADETCSCNDCPFMKMNTLEKVYNALNVEQPELLLAEDLMEKARLPIQRMLDLSKKLKLIK